MIESFPKFIQKKVQANENLPKNQRLKGKLPRNDKLNYKIGDEKNIVLIFKEFENSKSSKRRHK